MSSLVLHNARLVTPAGVIGQAWLRISGSQIDAVEAGSRPVADGPSRDLGGAFLAPGFIDMHVHGGGGASVVEGEPEQVRRSVAYHRAHGTTGLLLSLVTAPLARMEAAVRRIAILVEQKEPAVLGCHLEGPFLSRRRCGAQDPRFMLPPDPEALGRLFEMGRGCIRMVTVAPEAPGALDLVRRTVAEGAVAAVGHTDASSDQVTAAIEAGARVGTHLFNGMRPFSHRDPGPVGALLSDERVVCELINDGVHVAPEVVQIVFNAAPGRVALITDAIAAAGMPDGDYELGSLAVRVSEGRPALKEGGSLAGSTLTMDRAVRRTVQDARQSLPTAVAAASKVPAQVLGLAKWLGSVEVGKQADLAVLGADLELQAVVARGVWQEAAGRGRPADLLAE
ncbi:MAG: N-acetylglucosamine-6-phosphate deacetylase [Candidatus Dormibacteraeota bacterium]|uniref:N-acetylglucosamine-6-phosphate deacetylase n=1 Tax=Candidatus Dormiibacter inghamiae TaxID=3127013 RepID=A0A934K9J5_9BACT|nr:N-acetylglucosamine-6-phosphate deacetylase [Candidatus Dormibacteraeota bacterium]MBJ7606055.1 N-acetylglucosamine-6-phosphate deacetylase [Candidatus Dormibacteraeota bacterium]